MKIIVCKDAAEVAARAAEIMQAVVCEKSDAVLGLATGSTPLGLYHNLIDAHNREGIDYSHVTTVNLDEYAGLPADNDQSYAYFMRHNLFDGLGIAPTQTHIENGMATDPAAECARYDALLEALPRDIQLLGIGSNGHIAFNEPGTSFDTTTHVVDLKESTIRDNARFFASMEEVPRQAFTMGMKQIMDAKQILILATGEAKADAVYGMVEGEVTTALPASILQTHPACTLICDEAAARRLTNV